MRTCRLPAKNWDRFGREDGQGTHCPSGLWTSACYTYVMAAYPLGGTTRMPVQSPTNSWRVLQCAALCPGNVSPVNGLLGLQNVAGGCSRCEAYTQAMVLQFHRIRTIMIRSALLIIKCRQCFIDDRATFSTERLALLQCVKQEQKEAARSELNPWRHPDLVY